MIMCGFTVLDESGLEMIAVVEAPLAFSPVDGSQ
jgi:hypothetical protein